MCQIHENWAGIQEKLHGHEFGPIAPLQYTLFRVLSTVHASYVRVHASINIA